MARSKKKSPNLKPASPEVEKQQTKGYTEDDFLDALEKATNRLDQDSSGPDPGSPRTEDENRPAD